MELKSPTSMLHEAARLSRAGRLPEAAAIYTRLLSRWPDLPDSWYNLALIQRRLGRSDEALQSYQQALDRGIKQREEVHLNRGVIFSDDLRHDDAAEVEVKMALAINPNYVPAHLNLANLKEDRGDRQGALELYERALAIDPRCYEALVRAAHLAMAASTDDPMIQRLKQAIADERADPADKASLSFALGKVLDQCGDYDGAFEAYRAANRDSRASVGFEGARYDRRAHERLVDQLIGAFHSVEVKKTILPPAQPPIFVCGMFRSGSTLVEQVLAGHPRVTPGGEIGALPSLVRAELSPFPAAMRGATEEKLAMLATRYRSYVSTLFPDADLVTDKRPDNFLYIGLIKRLFPYAKVIHTTRNPLDNCLSIFFLHLDQSMSYALDLADTGHYFLQYRRLMAHWKEIIGDDIIDFDYDNFVRNPKPCVASLLQSLGLEWNDACLAFHERRNTVKTASVWQVREPLYNRSSGRWRNYKAHLAQLRAYLKDVIPDSEA